MGAVFSTLMQLRRKSPASFLLAGMLMLYFAKRRRDVQRRRLQRKKQSQKEQSAISSRGMEKRSAKGKGRKRRDPKAMQKVFWRLWPFGKSAKELKETGGEAGAGRLELIAIFAVSMARTWHQNRMVYIKRDLMIATYKRDMDLFKGILFQTAWMSVLSSLIFATHRYLKERLTNVWREKLTAQLHRSYFKGMNYYKLSHLNKSEIDDVEERIVKDPRRFTKGLAAEMEKLSAAMTSGVWFTYKLFTISSLPYALSPLL